MLKIIITKESMMGMSIMAHRIEQRIKEKFEDKLGIIEGG